LEAEQIGSDDDRADSKIFIRARTGGMREVDVPEYPDSPNGLKLRDIRLTRGIGLRDGARILGISVIEFSSLETGRFTLPDEQWPVVFKILEDWKS
jgi:hypothetical protein